MSSPPPVQAWYSLSDVIERIGDGSFERALFQWMSHLAAISVLFAFEIFDDDRPGRVLVTEGNDADITERAWEISRDYAATDYTIDEVFNRQRPARPGRMRLVTQRSEDREEAFRRKYFDEMGVPQEVSLFHRTDDSTLYLGVSSLSDGYSDEKIIWLKSILPVALSLVRRHAELVGDPSEGQPSKREDKIARMLAKQGPDLTPREVEVCAAIVMGYRAEAIAARLDIAPNTVATHRKRAYAKLHISSQTELFGFLFTKLADGP